MLEDTIFIFLVEYIDYMNKRIKKALDWINSQPKSRQRMIYYCTIIVVGLIALVILTSVGGTGAGLIPKNRTSLLGRERTSLISDSLINRLKVENKTSFATYLCGVMFKKGFTNITVAGNFFNGNVTMYDYATQTYHNETITWMTLVDYKCYANITGINTCVCIEPV